MSITLPDRVYVMTDEGTVISEEEDSIICSEDTNNNNKYQCSFNLTTPADLDKLVSGQTCRVQNEKGGCIFKNRLNPPKNTKDKPCFGQLSIDQDQILFKCIDLVGPPKTACVDNVDCIGGAEGPTGIENCPGFYCLGGRTRPCPKGLVWDKTFCNYPPTR